MTREVHRRAYREVEEQPLDGDARGHPKETRRRSAATPPVRRRRTASQRKHKGSPVLTGVLIAGICVAVGFGIAQWGLDPGDRSEPPQTAVQFRDPDEFRGYGLPSIERDRRIRRDAEAMQEAAELIRDCPRCGKAAVKGKRCPTCGAMVPK